MFLFKGELVRVGESWWRRDRMNAKFALKAKCEGRVQGKMRRSRLQGKHEVRIWAIECEVRVCIQTQSLGWLKYEGWVNSRELGLEGR